MAKGRGIKDCCLLCEARVHCRRLCRKARRYVRLVEVTTASRKMQRRIIYQYQMDREKAKHLDTFLYGSGEEE